MKKVTALLLTLLLCLSLFPVLSAGALGEELLLNPGFEASGSSAASWSVTDTYSIVSDAHSGSRALKVTKSDKGWYGAHQFPTDAVRAAGHGFFEASCWMKAGSGDSVGQPVRLTIKQYYETLDPSYTQSPVITLSTSWQKATVKVYVTDFEDFDFYWYTGSSYATCVIIDDCSLVKTKDEGSLPVPDPTLVRGDELMVGAVRWDAYFQTSATPYSYRPSDQVARTLSYYPYQMPYFACERTSAYADVKFTFPSAYDTYGTTYTYDDVTKSNLASVTVPYTYAVPWEEEAVLALDANLDYFAYVWYKDTDPMSLPRKAHVATQGYVEDGRQMKMAIIAMNNFGTPQTLTGKTDAQIVSGLNTERKLLYQALSSRCQLTVKDENGQERPVLYCYNAADWADEAILNSFVAEVKVYSRVLAAHDPVRYRAVDDLYLVAMYGGSLNEGSVNLLRSAGYDALSQYSAAYTVSSPAAQTDPDILHEQMKRREYSDLNGTDESDIDVYSHSYNTLVTRHEAYIGNMLALSDKISSVPLATAGRFQLPRVKTGVSWTGDYGCQYTRKGTSEEIAAHLTRVMTLVKENPDATPANAVLIYAWNEHDEGGFLCPVYATDKDGNVVHGPDGKRLIDSSVLNAVGQAIAEFKGLTYLRGDVNGDGEINATDLTAMARLVARIDVLTDRQKIKNANVHEGRGLTADDLTLLARYVARIISDDEWFSVPAVHDETDEDL